MYAYAPNGLAIVGTKDLVPGVAGIIEGGFRLRADGRLDCDQDGTRMDWDAQRTVVVRGEQMVVDADGDDWPVCAVIALDHELDQSEDEELPADRVAAAEAALKAWKAKKAA